LSTQVYSSHLGEQQPVVFFKEGEDEVWAAARSEAVFRGEAISKVKTLKSGAKGVEA
jgi:hypothetical protein